MALDETVKRLRALLENATPGPWRMARNYYGGAFINAGTNTDIADVLSRRGVESQEQCEANADFIAEARNALPDLLAAADLLCRLERMNDIHERRNDIAACPPLRLEDALEAARREQAREGGSDGR